MHEEIPMLLSAIPVKTQAGRLEIDERKLKIGPRQRMVLISINGERPVESIRQQFAAISEIDAVLDELLATGLIEVPAGALAIEPATPVAAKPVAAVVAAVVPASPMAKTTVGATKPAPAAVVSNESLQAARDYMARILSAKIGLRAFLFTQKIEKTSTREALIELLPEFRRQLRKHVDAGRVAEFSAHVEELIGPY